MLKRSDPRSLPKPVRGLSKSTRTLLIVVVAIIVIVVLFFIIRGIAKPNAEENSLDKLNANLKISEVQIINYTDFNLNIKGNTSGGNVDSVNFIVYGEDGSEITRQKVSIQQLEEDDFQVSLHISNTSKIKEISVAPTFISESGNKVVGKVEDTYTVSDEEKYQGEPTCVSETDSTFCSRLGKNCGSDGCGGSCGSCTGGEICNGAGQCVITCTDKCSSLGYSCGIHLICGVSTNCGSCGGGGGGGSGCTDTCLSLNYNCGTQTVCGLSTNCGACSLVNAVASCSASYQCVISSCNSGYANCDSNATNGCETQLGTTSNCASCGNACTTGQTCTGGVCTNPVATCSDRIQNQGETGIDCGGPCSACLIPVNYLRTFYVNATTGNDANDGRSPANAWRTISKVNSYSFLPGDGILFKRGDTWYGTLTVSSSGNSTFPITYSAYGTGAKPIITGFTTISGWTNEGGGIYSKTISCQSNPNLLVIDGNQYAMGRYPKAGTNAIYTSHSTDVSITDANLNSAVTNWTGAEVYVRWNEYLADRCVITNHVSHTLTYKDKGGDSPSDATNGYYYFIQNDLRTLGSINGVAPNFGEWYYNGTKLYVYFGAVDPTTKTVQLPTLNRLFYVYFTLSHITIDGLSFKGANDRVIYFWNSNYGTVKNCNIDFSGAEGIWMGEAVGLIIDNNTINHTNADGIYNAGAATITNNTITNVGVIEGIPLMGGYTAGIENAGGNTLIQYNKIDSVGANGIHFGKNNVIIKNNIVSNFALTMNDKGGINTDGWTPYTGEIIDGNIVFNGRGNPGKASYGYSVNGIYLDSYSGHITVTNNTLFNNSQNGITLSNPNNITLQHNTCYNNGKSEIYFLEWDPNTISGITMTDNIFFAKTAYDYAMQVQVNVGTLGNSWGTADRNYYTRPIAENTTIETFEAAIDNNQWQLRTLANWQAYSGQDVHSHKSPKSITNLNDLLFEYNPTKVDKIVTLSGSYIDVKGTAYSGSVTLKPYTSIVLIKN